MIEEIQHQSALEARAAARRIGLIALATDHTVEADFRRLVASDDIAVHVTRVGYANPTTPENLRAMHPHLATAAALLLPGEALDAVVYGCTSASVVIGEEAVTAAIREGKPGATVITPAGAAVLALRALKARHISILTPYIRQTAEPMQAYFEANGFAVNRLVCLGMEDDRDMARLPQAEIVRLAAGIAAGTEALFIACTALRAAQCAPEIERQTGLPVVTSNLAAAWASLRQCGIAPDPKAACRLLATA
ncbi:aspartate/glutamate racemase family protein [Shinella sp. HZN7]|uniref:aspartate racemase/maleate isomerase family protein n=1 Tax=Shinella sp. (strain HZN7) TaxID=879274 RepID=UPI0007DA6A41|nr:aspartate/glutamate racemase family protein [Shinella sp. HZN7]ANH08261.1 ectoine utilization protein EutA [Shinella sp. HZN7]